MKHLLAYLFIVLGLGLVFSINANSQVVFCSEILAERHFYISAHHECGKKYKSVSPKDYVKGVILNIDWELDENGKRKFYGPINFKIEEIYREFTKYGIDIKIVDQVLSNLKLNKYIAKAEPSQTQKVADKIEYSCNYKAIEKFLNVSIMGKVINYENFDYRIEYQNDRYILFYPINSSYGPKVFDKKTNLLKGIFGTKKDEVIKNILDNRLNPAYAECSNTKIAKVEPTIKPKKKKKIKVAEGAIDIWNLDKEEPKQEEFKPKKTNQDNEAPVIEIAEAITVNDTSYILEGRVTDKADKIFVEIDGQPVQVKKGKFKVKRYSPVDEQIKIVAIDQWGNKSKTKLVSITIDIEETTVANKLEPLNPSNISNKSSNNKVALIIGIENYTEAPKANYANLDAKYFFDYARKAFGVKKQNINLLVNEEATVVKTDKAVSLWLKSKIKKNKSDLIIFFAGHGLASSDGKELYLLPQDGNPDRLERTALSRTDLFKEIISLNPKSVTMFLDTCYSGVSRDEQMLLASARPVRIVADEQEGIPDNFTIFSASQLDQISSGLKEANHGIFSYYLMKGLEGKADSNQDKKITNGELLAYMDENVSQKAAEQGREQNPSLAGDPDKVLMSYR